MSIKKEIIVNCGISHVSASVFHSDGQAITLKQVGMQTLHYDYSNDQLWLEALINGLESLCSKEKLKGNARFIFPGGLLLNKTIRVPHVDEEKQKKIVAFELSQKMPFPLSELIWDYQVIDDDGVEQEILAFAVKPEVAESFCEKVVSIGLNPTQITPAPILDYNAFISSGISLDQEETLVVNVGAKSTNLLFINPTGFLIRSIAIGGNTLTQNISDNLGSHFEKAEEVKKSYFSGQIAFSPEDPSVQVLENCAQQFLARASQEITRSIVTYKRLKKGKSPARIYLAGRGALLNNLPEYLSQSQSLNIDYFDPLKSVVLDESISQEIKALLPFIIGEHIGLAHAVFNLDQQEKVVKRPINLLPANKLNSLNFKSKTPILIFSMLLFSLIPIPSIISKNLAENRLHRELEFLKQQTNDLRKQINQKETLQKKFNFSELLNNNLLQRNQNFRVKSLSCWALQDFLNQLQSSLEHPDIVDTWFDNLSLQENLSNINTRSSVLENVKNTPYKIILSGRYLVRPNEQFEDSESTLKRNHLIELNSKKQEALTEYLEKLPYIEKASKKTFSIEGKGDLFSRFFTHFEYEFIPSTDFY